MLDSVSARRVGYPEVAVYPLPQWTKVRGHKG